jgi:hypothetical protein
VAVERSGATNREVGMPKLQAAIPEKNVLDVSSKGVPALRKIRERINLFGTGLSYSFRTMQETVSSARSTVCLWMTLTSVTEPFARGA